MKDDLIFHMVEKKIWKVCKKNGKYIPESFEQEGFIHCSSGCQVNETANRTFKNNHHLLLLIIDVKRVEASVKYEHNEKLNKEYPHIYGPLNQDAILDKITFRPDRHGDFHFSFSSD